jgi:hypothetical protein
LAALLVKSSPRSTFKRRCTALEVRLVATLDLARWVPIVKIIRWERSLGRIKSVEKSRTGTILSSEMLWSR